MTASGLTCARRCARGRNPRRMFTIVRTRHLTRPYGGLSTFNRTRGERFIGEKREFNAHTRRERNALRQLHQRRLS
jgi:hypothetical protein